MSRIDCNAAGHTRWWLLSRGESSSRSGEATTQWALYNFCNSQFIITCALQFSESKILDLCHVEKLYVIALFYKQQRQIQSWVNIQRNTFQTICFVRLVVEILGGKHNLARCQLRVDFNNLLATPR